MMNNENMPKFLFTLLSEIGDKVCDHVPQEYDSLSIELNRDIDLAGVFEEFKAGSLTFTGSTEKRLLKDLYFQRGMSSKCDLRVSYLDMSDRTYKSFSNDFVLDFNTYKVVKLSNSINAIQLNTEVSGTVQKLRDRKATKVDLTKLVSLGNYSIAEIYHWADLKKILNFPEITIYNNAYYTNYDEFVLTASTITDRFTVPFDITSTDFNEANNVALTQDEPVVDWILFYNSEKDRDIELSDVVISVNFGTGTAVATLTFYFAIVDTDGVTLIDQDTIGSLTFASEQTKRLTYSKSMTGLNALLENQSIVIWGEINLVSGDFDFNFGNSGAVFPYTPSGIVANYVNSAQLQDVALYFEDGKLQSLPVYEALERNLQHILDTQFPLVSDLFGRLDVVKNADGDYYTSENQLRFANILNGLSIRGMALADINNSFAVSFSDMIKGLNSLYNVGVSSEGNKIRIEEREYFYKDTIAIDLSSRIDEQEIEYEVLPDLSYAIINSGYNSFDYEEIKGRGEYNTKSSRTSIATGKNVFDNISPLRADTRGITLAYEKRITVAGGGAAFGSTDIKSDKDIFIIKSQRNGTDEWDVEAEENIQVLNDTSIFGANSINLYFTPTRNLLRHNYEIAAALYTDRSSKLQFQDSDKLQNLETTDGADSIVENQDIVVEDLGSAKWRPAQYIVSLPFYEADIINLIENKHYLIRLSATKLGWLLKAKYRVAKHTVDLYILQKSESIPPASACFNVDSITLPTDAIEEVESTATICITNTGDLTVTQDVQIIWRNGTTIVRDVTVEKQIGFGSQICFEDSYTPVVGDASSSWTIEVITDCTDLTSSSFVILPSGTIFFDITSLNNPKKKTVGEIGQVRCEVENTGTLEGTQDIIIVWIRITPKSTTHNVTTLAASENVIIYENRLWETSDIGFWKIRAYTDDDYVETAEFEVVAAAGTVFFDVTKFYAEGAFGDSGAVFEEGDYYTVVYYIQNTGTISGSQDVTLTWRKGTEVKKTIVVPLTIASGVELGTANVYVGSIGDAGSWTLTVQTEDDIRVYSFTVVSTGAEYFNIEEVITPTASKEGSIASATVTIKNTGTAVGTQDIVVNWKKAGVTIYTTTIPNQTLGVLEEVELNPSVEFDFSDAGTDWTIEVVTDDESYTSPVFTVSGWSEYPNLLSGLVENIVNYTTMFDIGTDRYMIISSQVSAGANPVWLGYKWSGTTWISNTAIISGLPTFTSIISKPTTTFYIGSDLYMIIGIDNPHTTAFVGYKWNGSTWVSDTAIVSGLVNPTGDQTFISVFYIDTDLWAIAVTYLSGVKTIQSYKHSGSAWVSNTDVLIGINSDDIGTLSIFATFEYGGNTYIVNGTLASTGKTWKWNSISGWSEVAYLSGGFYLGFAGGTASIFYDGSDVYIISGSINFGEAFYAYKLI